MTYQLTVKAINLADEARTIRRKEIERLERARVYTRQQLQRVETRLNIVCETLEVIQNASNWMNNKETPEEKALMDRLISLRNRKKFLEEKLSGWQPNEKLQAKLRAEAADLRLHRIGIVRTEARATHIARGYLKGRSYVDMEGFANLVNATTNGVAWSRVRAMVEKYGTKEQINNFDPWLKSIGIERVVKTLPPREITRTVEVFNKIQHKETNLAA